jgi:hypothetical protein
MMVLFGGGDGGGFWVGADGKVHKIPPWTPDNMALLRASAAILKAGLHVSGHASLANELSAVAEKVTSSVIPVLAKGAELGAGAQVAFIDGDDGFTCGSTGKHPFPIPVPHGGFGRIG